MLKRSFSPPPQMQQQYYPPQVQQILPTQSSTMSNLIDSFNNDRSIVDAKIVEGPVAQIEITGNHKQQAYP